MIMNTKWVLALLVLMALGGQVGAQVVGPPDPYGPSLSFFAGFPPPSYDAIPVGGSPPNYGIQGQAVYSREIHIPPNYPVYRVYTNVLEVGLSFSSPPEDAWILEKESDGTFSRVAEITNLIDDSHLAQSFTLTVDEVHSLVAGNWYEEADFATSNYVGNLVPDYEFAAGPRIPDVVVRPAYT